MGTQRKTQNSQTQQAHTEAKLKNSKLKATQPQQNSKLKTQSSLLGPRAESERAKFLPRSARALSHVTAPRGGVRRQISCTTIATRTRFLHKRHNMRPHNARRRTADRTLTRLAPRHPALATVPALATLRSLPFVTASELFNSPDQEHSREWWKDRGAGLRLESERDAMELQFAVSGTLYFYEGRSDRVTATTICGAFPPSAIGEVVRFRNQPVRFALSEAAIEHAREQVSAAAEDGSDGGADGDAESDGEEKAAAAADAAREAAREERNAARAERLRLRGLQKPEQQVQPEGGLDLCAQQELKRRRRQNRVVESDSD